MDSAREGYQNQENMALGVPLKRNPWFFDAHDVFWYHFGAQNRAHSDKNHTILEKCRHAFGSSGLDPIAYWASPERSKIQQKRVRNSTQFRSSVIIENLAQSEPTGLPNEL